MAKINIPKGYETILSSAANYYEAVYNKVSEAYQTLASSSDLLDQIADKIGSVKGDIENVTSESLTLAKNLASAYIYFNTAKDEVINAISEIKNRIETALKTGDFTNIPDDIKKQILEMANADNTIDIDKLLANTEVLNSVADTLSSDINNATVKITKKGLAGYIKSKIESKIQQDLLTAGIDIAQDVLEGDFATAAKDGISKVLDMVAKGTFATEASDVTDDVAQNVLPDFLKGNAASIVVTSTANILLHAYQGKLTDEQAVKDVANAVTGTLISSGIAAVSSTATAAISTAALATGVGAVFVVAGVVATIAASHVVDGFVHDMYYIDGDIPKKFKKYDMEDYIESSEAFGETQYIEINGTKCTKGTAIPALQETGYSKEEAEAAVYYYTNDPSLQESVMTEDGYFSPEYYATRDYLEAKDYIADMSKDNINNYVKNQADTYFFDDKDRQAQYEAAYRKLIKNRPGDVSISNGGTKDVMDDIKAVEAK